jgi:protein TonB
VPAPKKSSSLVPLLIVGAIGTVLLMAGAAAAIMIVLMNRGTFTPSTQATDVPDSAEASAEAAGEAAAQAAAQAAAEAAAAADAPPMAPPDETVPVEQPPIAAAGDTAPPAPPRGGDVEAGARTATATAERRPSRQQTARPGDRLGSRVGGIAEAPPPPPPPMALRVGGNIRAPQKTRNVPPEYPGIAQRARVQGMVIIEATINREGRVSEARVLRSIPLLDQAALDAVRQWEYEPTLLNGVPVPLIMTVTVNFTLSR